MMDKDSQLIWEQYSEREYSHIIQFLTFEQYGDHLDSQGGADDLWFETGHEEMYIDDAIYGVIDNEGDKIALVYEGRDGSLVNALRGPEWGQPPVEMDMNDREKLESMIMSNPRNIQKLKQEVMDFNDRNDYNDEPAEMPEVHRNHEEPNIDPYDFYER